MSIRSASWLAAVLASSLGAQEWLRQQPSTVPPAAYGPGMVFDEMRDTMILFGGWNDRPNAWPPPQALAQTWALQNGTWAQRSPANSPPARAHHAMAYDSYTHKVVLFGGIDGNGSPMNDLWEYDGNTWSSTYHSYAPAPRGYPAMAFDSQIVVFGGWSPPFTYYGDTWTWNSSSGWHQLTGAQPPARRAAALAKVHYTNTTFPNGAFGLMLHGGRDPQQLLSDTWRLQWPGQTWVQLQNAGGPAREEHGMAFDPRSRQTFLASGHGLNTTVSNFADDLWRFDGEVWHEMLPTLRPTPTIGAAVAMDSARDRLVMFGGGTGASFGSVIDEHWEFGSTYPLQRIGTPCSNLSATPRISSASLAPRGGTWQLLMEGSQPAHPFRLGLWMLGFGNLSWNGAPLPQSLAFGGLPGCQLLVEPLATQFVVWQQNLFSHHSSIAVAIPNAPSLYGIRVFAQGLAGNATGLLGATDAVSAMIW